MIDQERERPAAAAADDRSPISGWLLEAGRSLFFLAPRWERVRVGPGPLMWLFIASVAFNVGVQRLLLGEGMRFYWQAVDMGWLATLLFLGMSWVAVRGRGEPPSWSGAAGGPDVPRLFGVLVAQGLWLVVPYSLLMVVLYKAWPTVRSGAVVSAGWYLVLAWAFLASAWLLVRPCKTVRQGLLLLAMRAGSLVLHVWAPTPYFWYPDPEAAPNQGDEPQRSKPLVLTQEVAEAQSGALLEALDAVQPQRRGLVDLYAITFAPDADEDVFSREGALVGRVMAERFDARGRVLQLQNHADTAATLPWATPLNLHRAIDRAAERMDRDDDILFIHLTSHGGRDGHLAAAFGPLTVDEVTPQQLRTWLDDAGVRYRVVSVSACYSGSWIQPLSGPGTLVMTAADAEHTSYGCGRKSELTFFGRAMYDEQLRQTWSFENAHAVARAVIERREKEAGKTDGYSNPQIFVGIEVRAQLAKLEARLAKQQPPPAAASAASR